MTTIKTKVTVEIWDDPEFCLGEYSRDGKCPQLKELKHLKQAFTFHYEKEIQEKCPQCKETYQRSKNSKSEFYRVLNEHQRTD